MKTALVTGGAKRIGAAICRDLAENGYNVFFQYISSEQEAEILAEELRQHGGKIATCEVDLMEPGSAKFIFDEARKAMGPIDLLVNNASIFKPDTAEEPDDELWDMHFNIHVKAPIFLTRQLAKQDDIDSALAVNIIDQRVLRLNPTFFSYTLSKSALWTATQTMAQALAPKVRINAIGPGPTLANERQSAEDFQRQLDGLIMKQGANLDEFGRTIRFLHEAPSITGQLFALDGGQHLAWETPDIKDIKE